MSNQTITYLVGACLGVFGLVLFCMLVVAPALSSYRRPLEKVAVVILSGLRARGIRRSRDRDRRADRARVAPHLLASPRDRG